MLLASRFAAQASPLLLQQDQQQHQASPEAVESREGLLQRRLRTAFDDPTWSDLVLRCRWPSPAAAAARAAGGGQEELKNLQGSSGELVDAGAPSSPPSPSSSSSSTSPSPAELREGEVASYHVHRVIVSSWSDALAQLCLPDNSSGYSHSTEPKGDAKLEISGSRSTRAKGDGLERHQQLEVLGVVEEEEDLGGSSTTSTSSCRCTAEQRGQRRKTTTTVVELQAAEPVDPSALRLLLAFLYSGDLAQALEDATAACRSDGPGCVESNAEQEQHQEQISSSFGFPSSMTANPRDLDVAAAATYDTISSPRESLDSSRTTAIDRSVLVRAAELGLAYGVPELDQQLKSSALAAPPEEIYTAAKAPMTPEEGEYEDDRVESPLDALLAAASQHPLVRATVAAVSIGEDAVSGSVMAAGGRSGLGGLDGRLRGTTERRAPARYSSPDVEVYKDTWEVRGKRKHAPTAADGSTSPTETRRSSRMRAQEYDVNSDDADVSNGEALDVPAMASFRQERAEDSDLFFSATKRRSSRIQPSDHRLSPTDSNKRMKEGLDDDEEDDGEYDQRHESARIVATANKKRRAVAKAKQTRENAVAPLPDDDNGDEETFTLIENDHTLDDDEETLPAPAAIHSRPPALTSPRRGNDVTVEQPLKTETQVLAAAAASGENRRSLKQLRKEHGKNCHNCKTRKIDFVTCLVRPTHRFCDGCLRKLFNVEFANAHLEWDGIVHREGCAICRHVCPCVGCRKRSHSVQSPAPPSTRTTKRPRDAEGANPQQQSSATIANGRNLGVAGSGDNDDAPLTKKPKQQKNDDDGAREEATSNEGNRRRRARSLTDGRQSQEESEKKLRRSSTDVHENEDSVEMVTDDVDAAPALPSVSTRSRSRRRESAAAAPMAYETAVSPPAAKSARSSRSRRGGSAASKSHTAAFNVPEGAGPEAFLGLVSAGSALSQRPQRRTPIRSAYD